MDANKIAGLRESVTRRYRLGRQVLDARKKELDLQYQELERWKDAKLAVLDFLIGEKSESAWLEDIPSFIGEIAELKEPTKVMPRRTKFPEPQVNQAQAVRLAIENIEENISNHAVRKWLNQNMREVASQVSPRSIRSELWRLEGIKIIEKVRVDGNMNIYRKTGKPIPNIPDEGVQGLLSGEGGD